MPTGWIRAYDAEVAAHGFGDRTDEERNARAEFRRDFTTPMFELEDSGSDVTRDLAWNTVVELPDGLSGGDLTRVTHDGEEGFVASSDVVELAWVARRTTGKHRFSSELSYQKGGKTVKHSMIWGDLVQIIEKGDDESRVKARGFTGMMKTSHLTDESLLEVYFVDVGQGDGVLVRTPDGRHLLIDGGLERSKQLTGKNAADFVDWKFFKDYGDHHVRLDSLMASHSDNDHYGGLHDLVRTNAAADRELDCLGVVVETLHHPGLSRWENRPDADPPHHDGLGPKSGDHFIRLLGDRDDAEAAIVNHADHELSGPWKWFFRDVLANADETAVERVGLSRSTLEDGGVLPELWPAADGCSIRVLGPVTEEVGGGPALRDLGKKGINTNGHSICLRVDYGKARILLTGDLNKESMDFLRDCYGDRIGAFECDVAKACHHGSHKISYRFLEAMRPAATVISSGDAEGHAHPRPEIVGASAITGFVSIDRDSDVLVTPLVYMTEVERSVSLGAVNRIDFSGLPVGDESVDGIIPGRHLDELSSAKRISPTEEAAIAAAPEAEREGLRDALRDRLGDLQDAALDGTLQATYYYSVPQGPMNAEHKEKKVWRSRVMERNHYGLVNVRTDGETIMCATMDETEDEWIIHDFPARFIVAEA